MLGSAFEMPYIFPDARCCSTIPLLSSSISCPKSLYYVLVQLLLLAAQSLSLPAALPDAAGTWVTDSVSGSLCVGGGHYRD